MGESVAIKVGEEVAEAVVKSRKDFVAEASAFELGHLFVPAMDLVRDGHLDNVATGVDLSVAGVPQPPRIALGSLRSQS